MSHSTIRHQCSRCTATRPGGRVILAQGSGLPCAPINSPLPTQTLINRLIRPTTPIARLELKRIATLESRLKMFKRSFAASKDKAGKARKISKRSFRDDAKQRMREVIENGVTPDTSPSLGGASPKLTSVIVTISVGKDQRLFAAHEDVLSRSPWFVEACREQFFTSPGQRRISLPDEEPEVFSAVLEYLYKGDYYPRLLHDRKRNTWSLEDDEGDLTAQSITPRPHSNKAGGLNELAVLYHHGVGDYVLKDTLVYCSALRFGLPELQRHALRKQGLQSGIDVACILRSARFAYDHTPPSDSRLRAHYLALIIRSRKTFKRSGTMQMEMEKGGTQMFFDLFVAMCNHVDDVVEIGQVSPFHHTAR
ncbi:hypothetical protein LTR53_011753 [Teratosphaeriaceae sp. CCFEE 6253]|nr:hypothetical protein LTR53_011753 [Teratosphaeriaceae sp. CCFEE 6253]